MTPCLRIHLLGALQVFHEDRVMSRFRTRKTGSLLAYLAYYRDSSHSREVLADMLWPAVPSSKARRSLSVALTSLRRQLALPGSASDPVLLADNFQVQLSPVAVSTDVADFKDSVRLAAGAGDPAKKVLQLTRAAGFYRGPLLPGYYDAWILSEEGRLRDLFFGVLDQLIDHFVEIGDPLQAIDHAHRAVAAEPLRESAYLSLVRLLASTGQQDDAARQFQEMTRILREELHQGPSPAALALARTIGHQAAELGGISRARVVSPGPPPPVNPFPGSSGPDPPDVQGPLLHLHPQAHLPVRLNRFFGREEEMALLLQWFSPGEPIPRLVTITGPGGSGKTRLAVEAARVLAPALDGAVWFVPLEDISDPGWIVGEIQDALSLSPARALDPLERLSEVVGGRYALILLDNLEHLMDRRGETGGEDASQVVKRLLTCIPSLQLLVTSRRALGLPGEQLLPIHPLPVPDTAAAPAALIRYPGVQLFLDRAQSVQPDFQITESNATAIAAVCKELEGLPLALELAAARVRTLTPAQMLPRLEGALDLLVRRGTDGSARQHSLRATTEWSYRLLPPALRRLLARLSVFRGGWSVPAAAAIATGLTRPVPEIGAALAPAGEQSSRSPEIQAGDQSRGHNSSRSLELLESVALLVEASLVLAVDNGPEPRFRLLELIRQFAGEQLSIEERAEIERIHALYYLSLVEQAIPELRGPQQGLWYDRLETERDNLRAAISRAALAGERLLCARLSLGLHRLLYHRGFWAEAGGCLQTAWEILTEETDPAACTSPEAPPGAPGIIPALSHLEPETLNTAADLAWHRASLYLDTGDIAAARTFAGISLQLRRGPGHTGDIAEALNLLGLIAEEGENPEAGEPYFLDALALAAGADHHARAVALHNLARLASRRENLAAAAGLYEQALGERSAAGDERGRADTLGAMGAIAQRSGDLRRAEDLYHRCLDLYQALGYPYGIAVTLNNLGEIAESLDRISEALDLFSRSLETFSQLHAPEAAIPARSLERLRGSAPSPVQ